VLNYVLNNFFDMPLSFSNIAVHVIAFTGTVKSALLGVTRAYCCYPGWQQSTRRSFWAVIRRHCSNSSAMDRQIDSPILYFKMRLWGLSESGWE